LNTDQKKQTTQNAAKQNYRYLDSIAFYDTRRGNEVGLFYNTPEATPVYQHQRNEFCQLIVAQSVVCKLIN